MLRFLVLFNACATASSSAPPADLAAPSADAQREKSGLASKVVHPGTGTIHPGPQSIVLVHYSGWQTDGHLFDSSIKRGTPATFSLHALIEGWREGLELMVEGETRRFWIPEALAYKGGAPTGMLIFDVELIQIVE